MTTRAASLPTLGHPVRPIGSPIDELIAPGHAGGDVEV
jgi:hypothetical protein